MTKVYPLILTKEQKDKILETAESEDEFDYMFFLTLATTGRRIGELYGVQEKEVKGLRKIGIRKYYKDGVPREEDKLKKIYRKINKWRFGIKVEDINFQEGTMKIWTLKKRKFTDQDVIPLIPKTFRTISQYIKKNNLGQKDYIFRKKSLSTIQLRLKYYAEKSGVPIIHEKEGLKFSLSPHCVSEDTEILTCDGWKKYNELLLNEEIYNLNKNFEITKDIIKDFFIYQFDEELFKIKSDYIDTIITPEHKIPIKYSIGKQRNNKRKDIWNNHQFIEASKIKSIKNLRQMKYLISAFKKEGKNIGKAKAGILGWILSDGHLFRYKKGNVYSIAIFQSLTANPEKCKYIEDLLIEGKIPYTKKIREIKGFSDKISQIAIFYLIKGGSGNHKKETRGKNFDWIFEFINPDRTPKIRILELCGEELQEIYNCMMLGDGHRNEYMGQGKEKVEFFRLLCFFIGKRTFQGIKKQNGKKYSRVYITHQKDCDILRRITKINYNGKVWCPETNNGNFIARRNGTTFITGNSFRHYFITELQKVGVPNDKIIKLTGHKDIKTLSIYSHTLGIDFKKEILPIISEI